MLGVRLDDETTRRLDAHARALGRPKSALVREWIVDALRKLTRDDELIRQSREATKGGSEDADFWYDNSVLAEPEE